MSHGPKLNRDWVGLRVRLLRHIENGYGFTPAGTECEVRSVTGGHGMTLLTDKCDCCGKQFYMSGLQRNDVSILTPPEQWKDTRPKSRRERR